MCLGAKEVDMGRLPLAKPSGSSESDRRLLTERKTPHIS